MTVQFEKVVPVFRIFSVEKASEFYIDFLGFKIDWEGRRSPEAPVFMQISRAGLVIHLTEHHGDATPGSRAFVYVTGIKALHRELTDKNYRHNRPGLQQQEWGMTDLTVTDPFNNRITFSEPTEVAPA